MLRLLSGKEHRVLTGVCLLFARPASEGLWKDVRCAVTRVQFRELSDAEIEEYVGTGEPFDKAGAYAIQGRAAAFAMELRGSYSGIMGLPLYETSRLLARFG